MSKTTSLRSIAIAAIAAASLALPMMSAAQAQPGAHHRHKAIYNTTRDPSTTSGLTRGSTQNAEPAFQDYSTFPEGSPSYHGSNGS